MAAFPSRPVGAPAPLERQILEALPITVYTVDLDGRITFVKPRLSGEAVVDAPIWDAMAGAVPREWIESAMALLRAGRAPSLTWESPGSGPAAEERRSVVQVGPLTDGHAITGFVVATVDVTPSHRPAGQAGPAIDGTAIVRSEEQQRHLAALGEIAAGVAHGLHNPLVAISSAAQLLRYRVRDDPVVEKNVGRVLREVERLNGMATALLEYGRLAPVRLAPGDPDAVWHGVIEGQRGLLESKALVLTHVPVAPRATCDIDAEQLAQAFVKLLVNAVDAAPEGSDLTLTSTTLPAGAWQCRLHNGGPAIPPDALPRVFELFFSTKPGGTGLGLALCQRIVEEQRGRVSIDSSAERGTTVTVILPERIAH